MSKRDEQRLRASEKKMFRRMLGISRKEKNTNERVMEELIKIYRQDLKGFMKMVKRRKFKFYRHTVPGEGIVEAKMEGAMGE